MCNRVTMEPHAPVVLSFTLQQSCGHVHATWFVPCSTAVQNASKPIKIAVCNTSKLQLPPTHKCFQLFPMKPSMQPHLILAATHKHQGCCHTRHIREHFAMRAPGNEQCEATSPNPAPNVACMLVLVHLGAKHMPAAPCSWLHLCQVVDTLKHICPSASTE